MQIMAFFIHSQVIRHHRVLVTQKCRLLTGELLSLLIPFVVLVTQKCRLEKLNGRSICIGIAFAG